MIPLLNSSQSQNWRVTRVFRKLLVDLSAQGPADSQAFRGLLPGVAALMALVAGTGHANVDCDGVISAIEFKGNKVTLDRTLLQRLEFRAGSKCSQTALESSRQAMMNTGLFKSVAVHFNPRTAVVRFDVEERIYRFLLPRLSRSADGDLKVGGQLRFDNVMGRNHKMKITARREQGTGSGHAGNSLAAGYEIPRFFNSDLGLFVGVGGSSKTESSVRDTNVIGKVKRQERGAAVRITRYLQDQTSLQGWKIDLGVVVASRDYALISGELGSLVSGMTAELRVAGTYNAVQLEEYRRRGFEYGVELASARKSLVGDFTYSRLNLFYRGYVPLDNPKVLENVNYQLRLGGATDGPFGEASYRVGGSRSLRGFDKNLLHGNNMAVFNGEYLRSFAGHPRLRWAVISDFAAVKDDRKWRLANLRGSLGTGLRWKIRSLVNTDLNLDLAYGFGGGGGEARFYFGTNVVF